MCVQNPDPFAKLPLGFWRVHFIRSVLCATVNQHLAAWKKTHRKELALDRKALLYCKIKGS